MKANTLTQAQADAILACKAAPLTCDRSNLPAGGPGGRHVASGTMRDGSAFAADLAKALGIDQAKVESALKSARRVRHGQGAARPRRHADGGGMPGGGWPRHGRARWPRHRAAPAWAGMVAAGMGGPGGRAAAALPEPTCGRAMMCPA